MSLNFERFYPYLGAGAAAGIAFYFQVNFPKDDKEFLAASLSFGAVIAGFMATAKAILMALPNDSVIARLKESGYIKELSSYLASSIYGSMIFCILNVVGFFILKINSPVSSIFTSIWILLCTFTVLAFFRVARIMLAIMKY